MSKNLNDAAMAGNLKEVEMRLNMGEDVNQTQFPRYTTALHDATACGRTEVARLLIKRYIFIQDMWWQSSSIVTRTTVQHKISISIIIDILCK